MSTRPPLLSLDEALPLLLERALPLHAIESLSTFDAHARVLAQDLISQLQVPPLDNSSMDGYAVRCADVKQAGAVLQVIQRIPAGSQGTPLHEGQAARIFTGAPIPSGADAVVMQEDVKDLGDGQVAINIVPQKNQWIRKSGEDIQHDALVLKKGRRLTPADLGLAASLGLAQLQVAKSVRVALLSTGDELVTPGDIAPDQMLPGAIYNSNRFFLKILLEKTGCVVTDLGIVPDQLEATKKNLLEASRNHDLILTSGGVSVGEEDHIKPAVTALGELHLWSLAIKPGKPFAMGHINNESTQAHFMGLPGNPVSSFITFLLLVRPFLLKLQGASDVLPLSFPLRADFDWLRPDRRREFLRVKLNAARGLDLFENQSSGVLTSVSWADGVIDVPAGQAIHKGDSVSFISFAHWYL